MDWPHELLAALFVVLLLAAAWTDLASRTIPNTIVIIVAVIGATTRALTSPTAMLVSGAIALMFFLFLVLLYARGMLGGGDVKLAAAICLGLSPASVYKFIMITALAGGVLAFMHLAARWALRGWLPTAPPPRGASLIRRVFFAERWRIARHGSLCYGVAIACGGIWAVLESHIN